MFSDPAHWKATSSRRADEQHAGRAVDDLGDRLDGAPMQAGMKASGAVRVSMQRIHSRR